MPDPLELVFLDAKSAPRIRRRPAWHALVEEAAAAGWRASAEAPALPGPEIDEEDRAFVSLILARAAPTDAAGASSALAEAVRADGKRAVPLVLLAGELTFSFDEMAELQATLTTALPFAGGDEHMEAALGAARDFLATPGLLAAPAAFEGFTARLREAFRRTRRAVAPEYIQIQSERALVEQRRYQQRAFHGQPHLRAHIVGADRQSILAYVPSVAASLLPLSARLHARVVAELHPVADQLETQPLVARVVALARVVRA